MTTNKNPYSFTFLCISSVIFAICSCRPRSSANANLNSSTLGAGIDFGVGWSSEFESIKADCLVWDRTPIKVVNDFGGLLPSHLPAAINANFTDRANSSGARTYDAVTNTYREIPRGLNEVTWTIKRITKGEELARTLKVGLTDRIKPVGDAAQAPTSLFVQNMRFSEAKTFVFVDIRVISHSLKLDVSESDVGVKISPDAWTHFGASGSEETPADREKSLENFKARCGDRFISEVAVGASISMVLEINGGSAEIDRVLGHSNVTDRILNDTSSTNKNRFRDLMAQLTQNHDVSVAGFTLGGTLLNQLGTGSHFVTMRSTDDFVDAISEWVSATISKKMYVGISFESKPYSNLWNWNTVTNRSPPLPNQISADANSLLFLRLIENYRTLAHSIYQVVRAPTLYATNITPGGWFADETERNIRRLSDINIKALVKNHKVSQQALLPRCQPVRGILRIYRIGRNHSKWPPKRILGTIQAAYSHRTSIGSTSPASAHPRSWFRLSMWLGGISRMPQPRVR
jgi:hypothetical protein